MSDIKYGVLKSFPNALKPRPEDSAKAFKFLQQRPLPGIRRRNLWHWKATHVEQFPGPPSLPLDIAPLNESFAWRCAEYVTLLILLVYELSWLSGFEPLTLGGTCSHLATVWRKTQTSTLVLQNCHVMQKNTSRSRYTCIKVMSLSEFWTRVAR